jgi:DUF2075 family protein
MHRKLVIGREVAYTDDGDVITVSDSIFLDTLWGISPLKGNIYDSNAV